MAENPKATIVFSTYNRRDLLYQAIQAASKQTVPVKILVMDDASTDGTAEMVNHEFPDVEYHASPENRGPCYQRNRGIELAKTDIVFPLDDDSILQSPYTVEQTLAEFDDERVGVVAIPFINILQNTTVLTQAPDSSQIYLTHAYVAAAHAVRRTVFLKIGGYREFFFYMGEEGDVSIRLLQNGYFVRLGTADPIHHHQPPNRISIRADVFGRQNDLLFVYCNTPSLLLAPYLLGTATKGLIYGIKVNRLSNMLTGLRQGIHLAFSDAVNHTPVSPACFRLYRFLKRHDYVPLAEVESYFSTVMTWQHA